MSGVGVRMFVVVGVAVLLLGGVGALQSGHDQAARETGALDTANESFTVDEGNLTGFAESNRTDIVYNESVTVTQGGQTHEAGGNYSWHSTNGTLRVHTGSALTDNETANIAYGWHTPTEGQQSVESQTTLLTSVLGGPLVELLGLFVLLAAGVVLMRMGGK